VTESLIELVFDVSIGLVEIVLLIRPLIDYCLIVRFDLDETTGTSSIELLLLCDHANEVSFHGSLEAVLILLGVYDGWHLPSVNDALELPLEYLVKSVLLNEVNDTETHFLSLGVNNGQQRVVNDIGLRQTQGVIVYTDL
jgi:hypothetical protein